ncbi:MAG: FdhD protein [Actinomycetota bacterium]|jgi:FdhD protein|nr:FdhD protein [Actinomycetota bacterium]
MTASRRVRVTEVGVDGPRSREDCVAIEEPLEIRIETADGPVPLAVTMRTPGDDLELAAGFLLSEGVLRRPDDVVTLRHCQQVPRDRRENTVTARLAPGATVTATAMSRRFTVTSACGICGVESLEALAARGIEAVRSTPVDAALLLSLPQRLRAAQPTFERTGGLHAAGLFSPAGEVLCVREDVGRHNALDKVLGWALMQHLLPLEGHLVLVSGRTSFELAQKAICAGVGVLAGISAPSSLAIELAERFGLALAGFVRDQRLVLYAGALSTPVPPAACAQPAGR